MAHCIALDGKVTVRIQTDVSLADWHTFGLQARARWAATVTSVGDLRSLESTDQWACAGRIVLGMGSNVLFTKDFDGLVVRVQLKGREVLEGDSTYHRVKLAAGESWDEVVWWTVKQGIGGLENLVSIPGTVGAAPVQNIGAYGVELAEFVEHVEVIDLLDGDAKALSGDMLRFGYRDSVFKHHEGRYVITSVTLRMKKAWTPNLSYAGVGVAFQSEGPSPNDAERLARAIAGIRAAKLPDWRVMGNAGSFFKNPIVPASVHDALKATHPSLVSYPTADGAWKVAAGWLIDQLGFKGRSIGGAAVHDRQALVLVNRGNATGADLLALAKEIIDSVGDRFGVELSPEPSLF